jgi:hypothetical protein
MLLLARRLLARALALPTLAYVLWACGSSVRPSSAWFPPEGAVNIARVEGTRLFVSAATPDYPPVALLDGAVSPAEWKPGAGWETTFDGPLLRNRYFSPEQEVLDEPFEWEGLRRDFRAGKMHAALAWALFEFPKPRTISAVAVHTVNTSDLPANRFGVRDLLVEYYDQPTDRWMKVVPFDSRFGADNTVEENTRAHIAIAFHPVRTTHLRLAVRWTNDAEKTRSFTVMGRREEYARATVRIAEVEVFGTPEEGDVNASVAEEQFPEDALTDRAETSAPPTTDEQAALQTVVAYAEAYAQHDVDALMQTISDTYLSDGETRQAFERRMRLTFSEFPYVVFEFGAPALHELEQTRATASLGYRLRLTPRLRQESVGTLTFALAKVGDAWRIEHIRSSR